MSAEINTSIARRRFTAYITRINRSILLKEKKRRSEYYKKKYSIDLAGRTNNIYNNLKTFTNLCFKKNPEWRRKVMSKKCYFKSKSPFKLDSNIIQYFSNMIHKLYIIKNPYKLGLEADMELESNLQDLEFVKKNISLLEEKSKNPNISRAMCIQIQKQMTEMTYLLNVITEICNKKIHLKNASAMIKFCNENKIENCLDGKIPDQLLAEFLHSHCKNNNLLMIPNYNE
jgi:predicted regulator of amino acid metabolism with ACT domain